MTDPSSTLSRNLEALGFEPKALSLEPQAGWRVEWTEPWPSLSIETEPGKWAALGSRRAPIDEARTQLAEARGDQGWPSLVVLLGAGLGYAIDVVEADAPSETRVLVIEPFAASAAALLARRDWTPLVESGRLSLIVGPKFSGAGDVWRLIDARKGASLVVPHAVLERVRPDAVGAARRIIERATFDASANAEARETLGGRYLVNTLRNLPRILATPNLRNWADSGRGQPAVICGAGPSLNRNLNELRPYRNRAVLIAVDTALRPILEAGFEPDLVVALDPSPLNARHLSGLSLPQGTWLVSEAALDPAAFDSFGDRAAFFRVGDNDPWPWLGDQGVDVPVLAAWGSVLTSAFALAEWLGADPVLLAGADLAFTNHQPYCRGTMFEVDWARAVLEGQTLPAYWRRQTTRRATEHLTGLDGEPVESAPHLIAFRDWLVARASKSGRRVVNATGAGILAGDGIEQGHASLLDSFSPTAPRRGAAEPARLSAPQLQQALAALRDDAPPLSGWIEGYARSLDRAMLDTALASLAAGDSREVEDFRTGSSGRALIALPESVAILRAARDGSALPVWAISSSAWDFRAPPAPSQLAAVLTRSRLSVADTSSGRLGAVSGHLNLLYDFEWPQPVLEAATALVVEIAARLRQAPPGGRLAQRFRPTHRPNDAPPTTTVRHGDRRALLFLASTWLLARTAGASDDYVARAACDVLDAASVALEQPPSTADARVRLAVGVPRSTTARCRAAAAISTTTLTAALRGALLGEARRRPRLSLGDGQVCIDITWDTATIDGDVLHRQFLDTVAYRVLTDEGLAKSLIATPAPDGTAILTARGQHASYRVRENGSFEQMSAWPSPIVGEVHGPAGAFAWTFTMPAALLFRRHQDAPVVSAEVPFQTYSAIWWQNSVVLTTSDGVWAWRPGEPPTKIAAIPPAVIALVAGDRIEVDPLPLEAGRLTRTRLRNGWTLDLRTRDIEPRQLSPLGQRWSSQMHDDVAAVSHPEADALILSGHDRQYCLLWPDLRAAVWVGRSLVLNTKSGEVALFKDVAATLRSAQS